MKPASWTGWIVAVAVAVILSALTMLGLGCLFRHGAGGAGCTPGGCGGRCGETTVQGNAK